MYIHFRQYRRWGIVFALASAGIIGGALFTRQAAHAQQEEQPRLFSTGPMGLTRGQTLRHIFHLHPLVPDEKASLHLTLMDTRGNDLVDTTFELTADGSVVADLMVLGDGSVRFNGQAVKFNLGRGDRLEIIPCFLVGNLSRGLPLEATAQCANNIRTVDGEERPGQTSFILPYVEATSPEVRAGAG
jgi:hypothetical protein